MAWWVLVVPTVSGRTIDQASFEPVYRQLARILREQIQAGELHPGAALPSEAALSQTFGVGRDAVRDALASLWTEGLVIGVGTFVREPAAEFTVLPDTHLHRLGPRHA